MTDTVSSLGHRDAFRLSADLPTGTTVLEASAGTGKTFTIAALAARYIAEGGATLDQLMLVTFGRMATNELRTRVRERLVNLERALAQRCSPEQHDANHHEPRHHDPAPTGDEVQQLLCTGDIDILTLRHRRILRALSDFDAATIATTHEFCLHMLDGLGVLGNKEPHAVFVEHLTELTREVASDVYLRRYANGDRPPPMSYDDALRLAEDVVVADHAPLVPQPAPDTVRDSSAERIGLAQEIRDEVRRRKVLGRLFTYDDMLTRLRDSLADPVYGDAAAERLRARYRIVLVDEFQDTDPVQWEILRRAFHGHATLILIGDPKQAIYAFRGADVLSYLDAVEDADNVFTLSTNWRSDQALIEAVEALVGSAALGDPRIAVRPVTAHHCQRRLLGPGNAGSQEGSSAAGGRPSVNSLTTPFRLRVERYDPELERLPFVSALRPAIVEDLVADITTVLNCGLQLELAGKLRRIVPSDIAVLVRRNERGEAIRDALAAAGVPAVLIGASSVFASDMARQWLTLLTALEQPRQSAVRQAALTNFLGWSFGRLAAADEEDLSQLSQRVRWWSRVLAGKGVAPLLEAITADTALAERLLSESDGERRLTDLRHIGQSLHAAMVSERLGANALIEWLRDRMGEARRNAMTDSTRRLETDAASVQILTVHRSKGLEFPIVYLPEAWDRPASSDEGGTLRLHSLPEETGGISTRVLDVGGVTGQGRAERLAACRREEAGEELRLMYVALTRAQCQLVTWWAPSRNTESSALHRFLQGPHSAGAQPDLRYPVRDDPFSCTHLNQGFSLETMGGRAPQRWQERRNTSPRLRAEIFDRTLDLAWRRTSYSALTAAVHGLDLSETAVGSEAEPAKEDDESHVASAVPAGSETEPAATAGMDQVSPMADLPSGTTFGTAVHAIFEAVDPQSPDLLGALRSAAADVLSRSEPGAMTAEALAAGLHPAYLTPLGPLAGQRRLCDIGSQDRLPELSFELPLAGGDQPGAEITLGDLRPLLRQHIAADAPLSPYADQLRHPALAEQSLRGYLTGSIDAVLRVPDGDGNPRYLVVDYKTNWLADFGGEVLTVGRYSPPRLVEAMIHAHYPLQALLYAVAVHRMLRWRQPGYDPTQHLGGVLYLFVRGMAGASTPVVDDVPCGVFSWLPPAQLIVELSDLLDGVRP
ncbi:MAG TPA: UvrD-helicase domain-containing protein [Dermatophilaceae bacterium]|nr:UvrD-helicase domain-containing protein [Dermatophilaceae bacterium]